MNNNYTNEKILSLAGLLHDIGKFMQRAEIENEKDFDNREFEKNKELFAKFYNGHYGYLHSAYTAYFIDKYIDDVNLKREILQISASHHVTKNEISNADRFSASMDRTIDDEHLSPEDLENIKERYEKKEQYKKIREQSIFDTIKLYKTYKKEDKYHKGINKIELDKIEFNNLGNIFPKDIDSKDLIPPEGKNLVQKYKNLWNDFINEYLNIKNIKNFNIFYNQLSYLLQKYTSNIPSSTINYPDISLYDHLRTTAAIASCLNGYSDKFILLEGDISGIQKFIFKITDAEDKSKVAKRLRGRSFYIWLLTEMFSKYIVDYFELTISNILYSGGGKFQIILPYIIKKDGNEISVSNELRKIEIEINKWLINNFDGLISIVFGVIEENFNVLDSSNERNYSHLLYEMSLKMQKKKKQKNFYDILLDKSFFINESEKKESIRKCKICGVKLKENEGLNSNICNSCEDHESIGKNLAKKDKIIIFSKKDLLIDNKEIENLIKIDFEKFGKVYITTKDKINNLVDKILNDINLFDIIKVNDTNEKDIIKGFKFLGDTVPMSLEKITSEDIDDINDEIEKNSPLTFEAISKLSIGDSKLGILKMDVDNLGMIFALGFEDSKNVKSKKSVSRIASLSRNFDIFFGGYLNKICIEVFERWKKEVELLNDKKLQNLISKLSNIFYITYSGGDDLFIVGPWDYIIELALEIRKELKRFTGYNPNIDISAGIAIVKNKYPIANAAELAEEYLERSKNYSSKKGMITVFNSTLSWDERIVDGLKHKSFENIFNKSKELLELVRNKKINRGLIHFIYKLNLRYEIAKHKYDPHYIPKLYYKIHRTVFDKNIEDKLIKDLIEDEYFYYFRFIGSYILEKTREFL
jgi:CRISPR-associated protein Csm1